MKPGSWTRRSILSTLIAILSVVALVWVFVADQQADTHQETSSIRIGAAPPDFTATNTVGQSVTLRGYEDQVVFLNFWASWCHPCVEEMPLIEEMYQSNEIDFELVSVNVGESRGTVNEFLKAHDISFPVIIDVTGTISEAYQLVGLPATFIIDHSGKLRQIKLGELTDKEQIKTLLEAAL
ncbi:redoxin domain-containing protein [Cohnella sp. WQ 127256]|uniref:TlpA family protein disulfide reductase n=1 Tax=Cohnella sp. WQ 127256 TaxID=2938790 RepID=UPI002119622F|nr:redoxin domain-containing protein [Cohnella sp. WQ 127256]